MATRVRVSDSQSADPAMMDRLLDSVDVAVEPVVPCAPAVPSSATAGMLPLAGGAGVCFTPRNVAILPPRQRPDAIVLGAYDSEGRVPILQAGIRIRVTYQGGVSLFDHLPQA